MPFERLPSPFVERSDTRRDETDPERIHRRFVELPSDQVELLASNLSRPDGFAKMLIVGQLMTSAELFRIIGSEAVRTNRGAYLSHRSGQEFHHGNDYLSFQVGIPDRFYASNPQVPRSGPSSPDRIKGLGTVMSAQDLVDDPRSFCLFGGFSTARNISLLKEAGIRDAAIETLADIPVERLARMDLQPPKERLPAMAHAARRADRMTGDDQGEVDLMRRPGARPGVSDAKGDGSAALPRIPLDDMVILVPEQSRSALARLIGLKIRELRPQAAPLREKLGVELDGLTGEAVLARYRNIYWYPQAHIGLAVQYLSTHPERFRELRGH
jgi:hypothetical protein